MIFSGHSRSLHLLRSASDESLATSQDAEAKQRDRRYTSPRADTTSRTEKTTPWFAPKAPDKETPTTEPSMRNEWPNGPPPSAPRSHRVAISPPTIRRSSNENEYEQRISDHSTTAPFTRQSFPSSVQWRRTDTLPTGSRSVDHGSEFRAIDFSVSAAETGKATPDPDIVISPNTMTNSNHSLDHDRPTRSALRRAALWAGDPDNSKSFVLERDSQEQPDNFSMHLDAAEPPQSERLFKLNNLTHLSPLQPKQQSGHPDETASVVSDLTMSSGAAVSGRSSITSGSRRRTCHKCKKAAQAVSPLFKCSECPRRYHPHCAVPKIPSSSQASGALDWICKHCVKNFPETDILATTPQSIPRNLTDKIGLQRESSPMGQSETKAAMAVSLTHYKGTHNLDVEAIEGRITLGAGASNGHQKAPADSDLRQAARNANDQRVPSNIEQLENSNNSVSYPNGRISEARAIKQEFMGGIFSAPVSNSSNPPRPQASTKKYGSTYDIETYSVVTPRKSAGTEFSGSLNDAVTSTQPTSSKPAVTNGFRQDRELKLQSSPSFDTSIHARHRRSQIGLDADDSEDDAMSISPEKSPEIVRSTSHVMTTTGRLQQPQAAVSSKMEIQSSKKSLKHLTCYHWKQRGGCRYREDECQYAHHDTGMDEGKNTTCFWWWKIGHCKKSERECLYAHRDTGLYAKPPPGYVPLKRPYVAPRSPDRLTRNSRDDHYSPPLSPNDMWNSANDMSARRSPSLPHHAVISSSIPESSWDQSKMSNMDPAANDKAEQKVVGVDPRLLRRPSSMSVQDTVGNSETFLTTSKTDMNVTFTSASADPVTPAPGPTSAIEPSSSFNKCRTCDKKVFGSASLCFTCKSTKPAASKAVKSSPFVPETPGLDTEMTPEVEHQPTFEVIPLSSPEKSATQTVNPLKRTNTVLGSGLDNNMFIKKKARIFKPSEPRRASGEMSPSQMDSPFVREKPTVPPRSNAAVGGIMTKTPVPLGELIELERLRKQVAQLEKSNTEEKKAHNEERRLRAEEKDRADKLSEELQTLKVRDGGMRKSSQEEEKKVTARATPNTEEQDHGTQDDAARTPQLAKRSKTRPNHVRQQSSNDIDRVSEASIQSPLRLRETPTDKHDTKLLRDMRARGIVFESDNESDDGPEVPPPIPFKPPKDPFWRPPNSSRDLFEVSPQYQQENLFFDLEAKKKEIASRPSRKQTFGRVLALSDRERGTVNVHREVDRCLPSRMVRTTVVDASSDMDPFKEAEQTREVEISFEEFLGVPENASLCLTTTQQLAYRDGALDRWGKLPRVPDDEKFEIGTKGV